MKEDSGKHPSRVAEIPIAIGLILAGFLLWFGFPQGPLVATNFNQLSLGGFGSNPLGSFTITNLSSRVVDCRATVEAPLDRALEHTQALGVCNAGGTIAPGATIRVELLVPGKKGVPFRVVVNCREPERFLTRLWLAASTQMQWLQKLWQPTAVRYRLIYSEWFTAPSDYSPGNQALADYTNEFQPGSKGGNLAPGHHSSRNRVPAKLDAR